MCMCRACSELEIVKLDVSVSVLLTVKYRKNDDGHSASLWSILSTAEFYKLLLAISHWLNSKHT